MSEKQEMKLIDDLIREALHLELECIETPPSAKVWRRIESRFDQPRSSLKWRTFSWSRAAAVAAACLVIVLGGISVLRNAQFSAPAADYEMAVGSGEETALLQSEDEKEGFSVSQEDDQRAVQNGQPFFTEPDLSPPDWPSALLADYLFGEALLLISGGEPHYHGARYFGSDADLLLVESGSDIETIDSFINLLGRHIGVELQVVDEADGYTRLTAPELTGLAWQKEGRNQALLVVSGYISVEELEKIAAALE